MAEEDTAAPVPANFLQMPFADGEYIFRLGVEQIAELQTKCGVGVGEVLARLIAGRYRNELTGQAVLNVIEAKFHHADVREVIRLALIGGGEGEVNGQKVEVTPPKALNLVKHYVDTRPLQEAWTVACAVMSAVVVGYTDPDALPGSKKKPVKAAAG